MNQEIELLGYKATITGIRPRTKFPPWHPEDELLAIIEFSKEDSPEGVLETVIAIPVKDYQSDVLLWAVKEFGEEQLSVMFASIRKEREMQKAKNARRKELDNLEG